MKQIHPSENHRHSSVSFDVRPSSRSREYPQNIVQGKGNLRDSSELSSGRSEGYNSAYDISSSEKHNVRGNNKSRKFQVKGYEGKERRDYEDELLNFHGRSLINDKGRYEYNGCKKYGNDHEDERNLDYEYRGSWHHHPRRDEYDEIEQPKKHRDHRNGSRDNVYRYAESRDVTSNNARSSTYQNSGRYSGSGGPQSSTGQHDQSGGSVDKSGKYPNSASSQSATYFQSSQNYDKSYQESQYRRGGTRLTSQGTREYGKSSQRVLGEEEPTSTYYRGSQGDHRAQYSHSRNQKPSYKGKYNNMAECNLIATAYKQPMKPYEEALRDLRDDDSDDENCYVSQSRYKECPDHVYMCRTVAVPNSYSRYPDLTNAHVLYGQWDQIPEDPHCTNIGPCEEEMSICPILTSIKKKSRMLSHEDLSPHHYKYREGVVNVPPLTREENTTDNEFQNKQEAKRRRYSIALQNGELEFTAHCGHKRGKCQYRDDSEEYAPETCGYDQQAPCVTGDYGDYNHPEEFINPDYPTCVVRQCTFEYGSPQYFGIPKARVNQAIPRAGIPEQKHLTGRVSSNKSTGTCICGSEKETGKRKHRCGFPTLHAEKNAKNPGEPFPHPKTWDNEPKNRAPDEYRRSSLKSRELNSGSTTKSDRGSFQRSGSESIYNAERGSYQRSSSLPLNMTMPHSVSLCADAACISSGLCGVSSSGGRYPGLDEKMSDGRSCSVSYASCKDLKRRLSPQTNNICCLPPLFADSIPRYPLPDPYGKEIADDVVNTLVNQATGKKDGGSSRSKSMSSSSKTSSVPSYKRRTTSFREMSSAWLSPWCHDTYTGWDPSYSCTAADDSCKYQSNQPYPRTSAVDRWPTYYGYLWKDMKTPVPRFQSQTCGRKFQTDYQTSNYNNSYICPMW